ncbi:MAG: Glyoxalase family protein [Actinomycetia bacterium]|jgi:predicted enzyme related to lactoylglutathione lyase|nr:Glyoxalase family protein [Actinomycetes bacterium]
MAQPDEATGTDQVGVDAGLSRNGGLSYVHIPAVDARRSAVFYETVFGWDVHGHDTARPGFTDGTGHVGGAWMTNQAVSREPGLLPYIYVDDIQATIAAIEANAGEIVDAVYPEGNLLIATFRDPAGNVMGVWQETAT